MPDMIPVGNTIIPPDPMKGVNTLSGIIGIQQQRQNLQTGGIQQQTAQAESQVAQRTNAEQQALATFVQNAVKDPAYKLPDGSADIQKFQQGAMAVAPSTQQEAIGRATSNFKEAIEVRKAVQSLSAEQSKQISGGLLDEANDKNSTPTTFLNRISQLRSMNPTDPGYNRMLDNLLMSADRNNTQQTAAKAVATFGGLSSKQPSSMDVGGAVQPGTTTAFGPGQGTFAPQGAPVQKVLGPTEKLPYVAAAETAKGAAAGQVGTDTEVFKNVLSAGANSQRGIELAQKIEKEAGQVRTGKLSQEFADRMTVLQQHDPTVTAIQVLRKDAENLKSLAEQAGATNDERNQIGSGYPTPATMDPDALQQAARYWQGSFRLAGARRDNALAHVSEKGSTAGLAVSDSSFMKGSAPGGFAPPEPTKPTTTASGAPQEGAKNTSKSGKPIIFTNGHWQYAK
jgi:hypothetical protein